MVAENITKFTEENRVVSVYSRGEIVAVHAMGEGELCSTVTDAELAQMRSQPAPGTPL